MTDSWFTTCGLVVLGSSRYLGVSTTLRGTRGGGGGGDNTGCRTFGVGGGGGGHATGGGGGLDTDCGDNPLNSNDYIHTKFMLVDPLGSDPLVVTGSANFSRPSQRINDENMLVIRGDTRVADIYFGEFFRIFDHHYARYVVRKIRNANQNDPDAGYLKPRAEDWVPGYFEADGPKSKRRKYFVG